MSKRRTPQHGTVRETKEVRRALRGLTRIAMVRHAQLANKRVGQFLTPSLCGTSRGLRWTLVAIRGPISGVLSPAKTCFAEILVEQDGFCNLAH